jgi:beta-lactam-binding protein with PASTA domain
MTDRRVVIGQGLSRARGAISSAIADPRLTIEYLGTDSAPPDMVIVQQPSAGSEVTPDSQIRLTVSTRPAGGMA